MVIAHGTTGVRLAAERRESSTHFASVHPDPEIHFAVAGRHQVPQAHIWTPWPWCERLRGTDLHLAHHVCSLAC